MSSRDPVYLDECECLKETDKALLVEIPDLGDEIWIPKSCVHDDSEVYREDDRGTLAVVQWWADQEGLG